MNKWTTHWKKGRPPLRWHCYRQTCHMMWEHDKFLQLLNQKRTRHPSKLHSIPLLHIKIKHMLFWVIWWNNWRQSLQLPIQTKLNLVQRPEKHFSRLTTQGMWDKKNGITNIPHYTNLPLHTNIYLLGKERSAQMSEHVDVSLRQLAWYKRGRATATFEKY